MSVQSKRSLASASLCLILVGYYIYNALSGNAPAGDDLQGWARRILMFLGIGVGANIVGMILFHIFYAIAAAIKGRAQEDEKVERLIASSFVEDERDKLIELKGMRVSLGIVGLGILAALVAMAFGQSMLVALHVICGAAAMSTVADGVVCAVLYEKGV